eukprot:GHVU01014281.1.p3 GENE.GHVU01014281.1~~GHVU01014281.1.p3  ORF type:complete len:108 (-),score=4.66 GHVU01014281.1:188-511(-)
MGGDGEGLRMGGRGMRLEAEWWGPPTGGLGYQGDVDWGGVVGRGIWGRLGLDMYKGGSNGVPKRKGLGRGGSGRLVGDGEGLKARVTGGVEAGGLPQGGRWMEVVGG